MSAAVVPTVGDAAPADAAAAAAFLRPHLARFGLLGTNNAVADPPLRPELPAKGGAFTEGDHFRFGYDEAVFGVRTGPTQRYWTEYGCPARAHAGFAAEFARAVAAIGEAAGGKLSVSAGGGYAVRAALAVARRLKLDIEQVVVEIDGVAPPLADRAVRVRRRRATFDAFAAFAFEFARRVGCADAWLALEAFHGTASSRVHLHDGAELRVINHGVDPAVGRVVAPADWSLVDNEKFTALDRWLIAERRPGAPQLLRWSPELVAAQLDCAPMRAWLEATARLEGDATRAAWTNQPARLRLFREAFPELPLPPDSRRAWRDEAFSARMQQLQRRLRHVAPGSAAQHQLPLGRLAAQLGIDLGPALRRADALHGEGAAAESAAADGVASLAETAAGEEHGEPAPAPGDRKPPPGPNSNGARPAADAPPPRPIAHRRVLAMREAIPPRLRGDAGPLRGAR